MQMKLWISCSRIKTQNKTFKTAVLLLNPILLFKKRLQRHAKKAKHDQERKILKQRRMTLILVTQGIRPNFYYQSQHKKEEKVVLHN